MLTTDKRPALIAVMALVSLMFPFLAGLDRHAAEAVDTSAASAATATTAATTKPEGPAPTPIPLPCPGLPAQPKACLDAFTGVLDAFAFPRPAFRKVLGSAEHDDACLAIPELDVAPAIGIVTLPDPLRSGLRYQYDRALEAVIEGIESRGYERDRFWLPWSRSDQKGDASKEGPDCSEDFPGLLLFRPSSSMPSAPPVALLVVGETPTWGIDRRALYTALNFAKANRITTGRVLGPYFSGSSRSLHDTIATWYAQQGGGSETKFKLVSGTATNPGNAATLASKTPLIEFSATTLHDAILERDFYRYLQRALGGTSKGGVLQGVAVLSESGTAYGSRVGRVEAAGATGSSGLVPEVTVRFPLHIAAVRAEYQEAQPRDKPPSVPIPQTSLAPIFDDPSERRDTPPVLSSETSTADDLVLSSELTALSQRGIRFIGIKATDAADILFLAHHIWEVLPDIRLFTFNHELFFGHPELTRELQGMLVVSSYSLFAPSQAWIYPFDDRAILGFSSAESKGVYNASIAIFDGAPNMPASRLVGYSRPFTVPAPDSGPSVWLSAVGMNGLWPLSFTGGTYEPTDHVYAPPSPAAEMHQPPVVRPARSWPFVALFLLGLCFWQFVAIGYVLFWRDPTKSMPRALRGFRAFRLRGVWTLERHAWACLALGTLASTCDMIGALALAGRVVPHAAWPAHWLVEVAILALAVLNAFIAPVLLGKILSHVAATSPTGASRAGRVLSAGLTFFVPITLAAVCGGYLQTGAPGGAANYVHQLALFYVRSTSVGSRLSPVVPLVLLFLASYVFCFVHLERLRLSDNPYFEMASAIVGQALTPGSVRGTNDAALWRFRVTDGEWSRGSWAVVVLAGLVPFCALTVKPLTTLEGSGVDVIFFVFFLFVIVMIVVGALRFLLVFRSMRALLRRVEEPRLLAALERIPKQVVGFGSPYRVQVEHLLRLRDLLHRDEGSFAKWQDPRSVAAAAEASSESSGLDRTLPTSSPTSEDEARKSAEVTRGKIEPLMSIVLKAVRWAREQPAYALPRGGAAAPSGEFLAPGTPARIAADAESWLEAAEEFVASNVAIVAQCFGSQLRNLLELMVGGALILALALSSYVFQPDRLLAAVAWATFVSVASITLYSFLEMWRRQAFVSLLKAPFGRGGLSIVGDAFMWVFVPLGAFLASQYPHTSNQLLSWLSPALAAFR
jgi:hypothetical protein